eukprot:8838525-Pyramimonas_sp.AAC.1
MCQVTPEIADVLGVTWHTFISPARVSPHDPSPCRKFLFDKCEPAECHTPASSTCLRRQAASALPFGSDRR